MIHSAQTQIVGIKTKTIFVFLIPYIYMSEKMRSKTVIGGNVFLEETIKKYNKY